MINKFIQMLSDCETPDKLFNPWNQSCETEIAKDGFIARRERLFNHLNIENPDLILTGEAPGYAGARYTGIPFTSERLLIEGAIPRVDSLNGTRITTRNRPWSEPSATIIWGHLHRLGLAESTVLWNAVPFHPEGKTPLSNRTPTKSEKDAYMDILIAFLRLYPDTTIGALGNVASESLKRLNVKHTRIRHPANGGATASGEGIRRISLNI